MKHKIAIIGSGPAGLAAAIYTARAELDTTIYMGEEPGGQLTKTTEIENYPGVIGKTGPELMILMQEQAVEFGAKLKWERVNQIRIQNLEFRIVSDRGRENYDGVILAMGASPKLLNIGEEKYYGKGFSTCAVCDAAFYKGKEVYVVGGGDAAIEEAWALTKFAKKVTMVVRRGELRASKIMQKRVLDNPERIKVLWNSELKEIRGEKVEELVLVVEGVEKTVKAEGLFLAIGHTPATGWLKNSGIELDEKGYVKTGIINSEFRIQNSELWVKGYPTMTSVSGVFAGGDCVDFRYRQAVTAAGMGVMAALDLEKWLER